ncbi:hypothetical protein SARC_01903 [Sphaeroforma arctica JP610]|uniref:Uncharacterized protein n=1 Tax=Sphaeroforma arctica JP610 TaxID=667725 RepID=A0A0L0GA98_9EUKA|nr:hypothetical protein SARC_01903 [Sphaeroforma arctica JP610]KNC85957.1 hypothetical protein SARC_01903 [Sphaeroforma arctica JP610]|eukprot:XP_014159859.1 hypothetical protein SARC_01903 [Sphaeroforma arctica JP610]
MLPHINQAKRLNTAHYCDDRAKLIYLSVFAKNVSIIYHLSEKDIQSPRRSLELLDKVKCPNTAHYCDQADLLVYFREERVDYLSSTLESDLVTPGVVTREDVVIGMLKVAKSLIGARKSYNVLTKAPPIGNFPTTTPNADFSPFFILRNNTPDNRTNHEPASNKRTRSHRPLIGLPIALYANHAHDRQKRS